jgi:hypothetical protein
MNRIPSFIISILAICFTLSGFSQKINVENIPAGTLKKFNILGVEVIKSIQFVDKNGINYLIATTEENTKDDYTTRRLWVEHFLDRGSNAPYLIREITDFERDCPVDNQLSLFPESFSIADADNNGYAEIIFLYKTGCKGDVSQSGLKMMVLENGTKAAMRGKTTIKEFNLAGEKIPDAAFRKLPKIIQDKADAIWHRFENEY